MIDPSSIHMNHGKIVSGHRHVGEHFNMTHSHYHTYYELYILEKGSRHHIIQGNAYTLEPWQCILLPPFTMHQSSGLDQEQYQRSIIYFTEDAIHSSCLKQQLQNTFSLYQPSEKIQYEIQHDVNSLFAAESDNNRMSEDMMCHLLNLILIRLTQSATLDLPQKRTHLIDDIIGYLDRHYPDPLSLDIIAKNFYINKYQLCRDFKEHTGTTIQKYVTHLRMMHATRLLQETNLSIQAIAHATGFQSMTHFGRVFKQHASMTPKKYQLLHRQ